MSARIMPLDPPYSPEIGEQLQKLMPPNTPQEPLKLFRVLVQHNDFSSRMRPFASGILVHGLLSPRERELIILRTCANSGAEYEWGVHVSAFSPAVGISQQEVIATKKPLDEGTWSEQDSILLTMVDQLHENSDIEDATWARASQIWDTARLLEILLVAGWYRTIAYVCNATRVPLEDWAARF